jgi:hypothetical protein
VGYEKGREAGGKVRYEWVEEEGVGGVCYERVVERYWRVEEERERSGLRERLGRGGIWKGTLTI